MNIEAMKQALEALESFREISDFTPAQAVHALTALREAIAEAEKQEPVAWRYTDARGHYRYRGYVPNFDAKYKLLKPQPLYTTPPAAPVQEPVAQTFGEENGELGFYPDDASNGQQRELVGEVEMGQLVGDGAHKSASNPDAKGEIAVIRGVDEYGPMLDWYEHWVNFPVGTKLYNTPPAAQRQWIGLTEQERDTLIAGGYDRDTIIMVEGLLKGNNT